MPEHVIHPLTLETWPAFEALAAKHNGVWGGCWCTYFHADTPQDGKREFGTQAFKRRMVEVGIAHAALVFDGDQAIAWCEYGTPAELPGIYYRKQYDEGVSEPPRFRITCFFVDRDHRRSGVAGEALAGALDLMQQAGGGLVEAFPHDTGGKRTSSSFLHSATRSLFERHGFEYERPLGKSKCVMLRHLPG